MPEFALPADVPVALLPVRLETRFAGTTLKIRVFPDQIHIDTHEADLTAEERAAGRQYWNAFWTAADDAAEQAAWDTLALRFGAERGSWIARALRPTNPQQRPATPPQFPVLTEPPPESAWTRAPLARALPTRWRAVGIPIGHEQLRARADGNEIAPDLAVGPSPRFDVGASPNDAPPVDDASRWLVDFDAAEARGMALTLAPPPDLPAGEFRGYRRLLVYGLLETADGQVGARTLTELLTAHHHTHGFTYLPQGVATNNTRGSRAAPSRRDRAYRDAHRPGLTPPPPVAADANAAVLTRALGLPLHPALAEAPGARDREQPRARWMQTALWQLTWGYFLTTMIGTAIPDAEVRRVRRHVLDHVRPAGPLPALRVAGQPYGVLPLLATSAYTERERTPRTADVLGAGTLDLLQRLRARIWEPSIASVPRAADRKGPETVVRILGMGAHAQAYYARSLLGMDYIAYLWRFLDPPLALGADWRTDLLSATARLGQRLDLGPWEPRVGRNVFADESFRIPGPIVEAPGATPASAYLRRLAAPDLGQGALNAALDVDAPAGTPLLYRLLRHDLLLEHAAAAERVRQRVGRPPADPEPELVDIVPGPPTDTVWRRLGEDARWATSIADRTPNQHWDLLAGALYFLGFAQWEAGDRAGGVRSLRRRVGVYERLAAADRPEAERLRYRPLVGQALVDLTGFRQEDPAGAVVAGRRAVEVMAELAGVVDLDDVSGVVPNQHWDLFAGALYFLGFAQWEAGDRAGGVRSLRRRVGVYERLAAADRPEAERLRYRPLVGQALVDLTGFRQEDPAGAVVAGRRAVEVMAELAGVVDLDDVSGVVPNQHWDLLAGALYFLAHAQRDTGDRASALTSMTRRVGVYRRLVAPDRPAAERERYRPVLATALVEEESFR
ncbi:hypothetical protein [Modestobacter sp. I12A-02662]|uniref:hypothetical protein n=1 Tax=Modestobacter sp. I12A-02662 TaxID=1730496 RepID=UPI0034E04A0C